MPINTDIYKGWVPVVAGRLSFRLVGNTSVPQPCEFINLAWQGGGLVVVQQVRTFNMDLLLGRPGLKSSGKGDETTECVFICVADWPASDDKLAPMSGTIAMLAECHWERFEQSFTAAQHALEAAVRTRTTPDQKHLDHIYQVVERIDVKARFTLTRGGEVELQLVHHNIYAESAEVISTKSEAIAMLKHGVASQIYFFLRDIAHHHKHHDPKSDALLDVWPLDTVRPEGWRQEVAVALWRTAVTMRRGFDGSAAGFVAYALAFKAICARAGSCPPLFASILHDPLLLSIEAQRARDMHRLAAEEAKSDFFLQTWVASAALLLGVLALLQLKSNSFNDAPAMPAFLFFGEFTLKYPWLGLPALFFLASVVARELTKARGTYRQTYLDIKISKSMRLYMAVMAPSKWKQWAIGFIAIAIGAVALLFPIAAPYLLDSIRTLLLKIASP